MVSINKIRFIGFIFLGLFLFYFSFNFFVYADEEIDWDSIKTKGASELNNVEKDLQTNFKLAVSEANLGEIKNSYKSFDRIGDNFNQNEINDFSNKQREELAENDIDYEQNILILNYIAFSQVIIEDYEEAIYYFDKILSLEPDNIWIRNYKAAGYIELELLDKAEDYLEATLNIKDNQFSHLLLGYIYYERDEMFKALRKVSRARALFDLILEMF